MDKSQQDFVGTACDPTPFATQTLGAPSPRWRQGACSAAVSSVLAQALQCHLGPWRARKRDIKKQCLLKLIKRTMILCIQLKLIKIFY